MPAKVILVCGKICSGKSYYVNQIKKESGAVVLSCDELTWDLFDNDLGDKHDAMMVRVHRYLHKKAAEIALAGCSVILEWGFWRRADRQYATDFYVNQGISVEWHYIDISDENWQRNIASRNAAVAAGETTDYALDEGLLHKLLSLFEEPTRDEIDVWVVNER
ncbi:MAG: ATP-binding protein [Clostridia bacterium]|nr:ATP-binding protein [Clostridia bacterium]